MLREIRDLGFDYAELSHGTRISLLPGILDAVSAGEIKISTLHNFCPLPMGVNHSAPNLYQFSDERPRQRELAERYTLKTIEFAVRVKASLVVLHVGSIEMKSYTDKLVEMVGRDEKETSKYKKLCAELDKKREAAKETHWQHTIVALKKIIPAAEAAGLKLGVENRESLEELPIESDYRELFREIPSPNLAYWHDTGHAQIKENLGFLHHPSHLESLQDRLYGFHIHDVQPPGRDHCIPGTGMIQWATLRPYVQPRHLKVLELAPGLPTEAVQDGYAFIKSVWGPE